MPDSPAEGPERSDPRDFTRPGQAAFVAGADLAADAASELVDPTQPRGRLRQVWRGLRRMPLFWVALLLIGLVVFTALFPGAFTAARPNNDCFLANRLAPGRPGHPLGFDKQGCDVLSRLVHGARASLTVGLGATAIVVALGGVLGALAGFFGGWLDAVLSRITDVFFAVPALLGAIVFQQMFRGSTSVLQVVLVLGLLGWPQLARIARAAAIEVRSADYVTAATALGAGRWRVLTRHVVPNALPPVIVTAGLFVGVAIAAEATLSFLGLGLPSRVMSWGQDIASASTRDVLSVAPGLLLYPAAALAVTVLGFVLLGDAVRRALDPRARGR